MSQEAERLRAEPERFGEEVGKLREAVEKSTGRVVRRGLLTSLLYVPITGATIYAAVRLALHRASSREPRPSPTRSLKR